MQIGFLYLRSGRTPSKICATIINLAKSLNLDTVAEGVETAEQLETLISMGCNVFQGYYFYKPLKAEEIGKLLTSTTETAPINIPENHDYAVK